MIVSCGEALIDFVPGNVADGRAAYVPCPGGSPFNIAIAVARLGVPAGFLGAISDDFFGDDLARTLAASGVETRYVERLARPSTLAFVSLGLEEPQYRFYDREAAHRFWAPGKPLERDVSLLHFGSIALVGQPAAERYVAFMAEQKGRRILSLDPNVRPGFVDDERAYRARLRHAFGLADVIKISAVDLAWLAPQAGHDSIAREWLAQGASLVVVTLGADGALAYGRDVRLQIPGEAIAVVDTVGAGDSFMGALLAALVRLGYETCEQLQALDAESIETAARFATRAAAKTCGRTGADPPWESELDLFEGR